MPSYSYLHDRDSLGISSKRFLHIHIPRCGGRFLYENLHQNGFECEQYVLTSLSGVEIMHFHRELYENHLEVENIPHFVVIRNPIDRFFSASIALKYMLGEDIQEEAENDFEGMLNRLPYTQGKQWFRSQLDYLTDSTHVWKFEDGLGDEFSEWLSNILEVKIRMIPNLYYEKVFFTNTQLEKTDKLLYNVKEYYKNDLNQLYPNETT